MGDRHVHAVSPYGLQNAGVRARMIEWLERSRAPYSLHSYLDGNSVGLRDVVQAPHLAIRAEKRMRQLPIGADDVPFLSRSASPFSKGGVERHVLREGHHSIYDLDDALFEDSRGTVFDAMFGKRQKAEAAAAEADVVIAGNDFIADWASTFNRTVHVVPTCIESSRYVVKTDYEIRGAVPRVVWLGTPSGEQYLSMIGDALARLSKRGVLHLIIVGSPEPRLGPLEDHVERIPWSLDFVHSRLHEFDLGIMPLANTSWERGKCAYKLLEYGAAGLPVVASPVGANSKILKQGGAPAPATIDEWEDALVDMCRGSAIKRRDVGLRMRDIVESQYSFEAWHDRWRAFTEI